MRPRSVLIAVFDGAQPLDFAGPYDVFNSVSRYSDPRLPAPYSVQTASLGGHPVRLAGGVQIQPDVDLEQVRHPDVLIVPGGPGADIPDADVVAWLVRRGHEARRLVSVCTGAFVLAQAGLLDDRRATTHWEYCTQFAHDYPQVQVQTGPIFVQDGHVYTSAGVTSGIDLALSLVEDDHGREMALKIARLLVVFLRRPASQAQLSTQLTVQSARQPRLADVQSWMIDHLDADLSVPALAERAGLSSRHFARLFTQQTGTSPGHYVDRIRLEAAQRMLVDTADGVDRIAHSCGWGTAESMRRAFVRELGMSPAAYRSSTRSEA